MAKAPTFQDIILTLERFWGERGCLIWQPHNVQVGAGTMNPATTLCVLGPEPWNVAYVEPSIRPADSRYGQNPNRMQRFYQYQVILKPEPSNPQELYLESLEALGIDCTRHDVRFVEDNWESPALGMWGLGWEVWLNGQEITQYTYFQQAGGFPTNPVCVELTYGLERIAMPLQGVRSFKEIEWVEGITYGDVLLQAEIEHSKYNLDYADISVLRGLFETYEAQGRRLLGLNLILPAYDFLLLCSHTFNVLDARGAVGVAERAHFFNRMRTLAREIAKAYIRQREELGFPRLRPWIARGVDLPAPAEVSMPPVRDCPAPLLLEIGVEELPAADVPAALEQLESNAIAMLRDARLSHGSLKVEGTPRRLVLLIEDIAPCQDDEIEERRGPPVRAAFDADGRPTKAAEGFARSAGVPLEALRTFREGDKEYVVAQIIRRGRPAAEILAELLPKLIASITFARSMRWNESGISFSRPIRWYVALLGDDVVPFEYAGVRSGRLTRGLRSQRSPVFPISSASTYFSTVASYGVKVEVDSRRRQIMEQAERLAGEVGGHISPDPTLLEEVTFLNECPHAILGRFSESFLSLPADVLIAVMRKHQRYFAIIGADGAMLPFFVVVANGDRVDVENVRAGNEEVLRARFADAAFFFEADTSHRLGDFVSKLSSLTFQERLGTMLDKTSRLEKLAVLVASRLALPAEQRSIVERAAHLAKADLATQMVIEITALQGVMGKEYALRSGESRAVAEAIFEQYLPRGSGDRLPATPAGIALALADRIDSLIGLIAIGMRPSGSADPFGMRRAALGLVQILCEHRVELSLREVFMEAGALLPVPCDSSIIDDAVEFVSGRLRGWLLDQGLRYDVVDASLAENAHNPYRTLQVARDLTRWVARDDWPAILAAYSRCARIVRGHDRIYPLRPDLFAEPATQALFEAYLTCRQALAPEAGVDEFFSAFIPMIPAVNRFFDDVLVMAEDITLRETRLGLLQHIVTLTRGIADLSKLEGF